MDKKSRNLEAMFKCKEDQKKEGKEKKSNVEKLVFAWGKGKKSRSISTYDGWNYKIFGKFFEDTISMYQNPREFHPKITA